MTRSRKHGWGLALGAAFLLAGGVAVGGEPERGRADDEPRPEPMKTEGTRTEGTKTEGTKATARDTDVLKKLHEANLEEIDLGKLAQDKGASEQARSFGKTLVDDHQKADDKVTDLAKKWGVDLTAVRVDAQKVDKFRSLSGADFDRQFGLAMVKGHAKVIDMVKKAQKQGDPDLSALCDELLPRLQEHHRLAKELAAGGGARTMGRRPAPQR
jgi:putative membrane protein